MFGVQEHPTAYTAQKTAASERVPGRMFAKVVMASAEGDLIRLVLAASSVVDVAMVSEVLGKQTRLASEGEFASAFLIARPGPCRRSGTCMTWRSTSLGRNERIVFRGGTHTVTMSVAYQDFERLASPTVADIAMTR